jgi:hypothetical protein
MLVVCFLCVCVCVCVCVSLFSIIFCSNFFQETFEKKEEKKKKQRSRTFAFGEVHKRVGIQRCQENGQENSFQENGLCFSKRKKFTPLVAGADQDPLIFNLPLSRCCVTAVETVHSPFPVPHFKTCLPLTAGRNVISTCNQKIERRAAIENVNSRLSASGQWWNTCLAQPYLDVFIPPNIDKNDFLISSPFKIKF